MNPLEEHPELFSTGRFKIKDYDGIHKIIGYNSSYPLGRGRLTELFMLKNSDLRPVGQGTLIARPIADMTDKEVYEAMDYREYYDPEYHAQEKEFRMELISRQRKYYIDNIRDFESRQSMLYLLSIGVYPFNQEHFNDGTVLNINEVT